MPRQRTRLNAAIKRMTSLFSRADRHIARYQKKTALACLNGCGRCCENPHVETTVAQTLPVARQLIDHGLAAETLQVLERNRANPICVLYRPDPLVPGRGRCSQYALRPLICRLFGFSARRNKRGQSEVLTCELIKAHDPRGVENAQALLDKGWKAPHMQDYALRASGILPEHNLTLPINAAIEKAIELVGLHESLSDRSPKDRR